MSSCPSQTIPCPNLSLTLFSEKQYLRPNQYSNVPSIDNPPTKPTTCQNSIIIIINLSITTTTKHPIPQIPIFQAHCNESLPSPQHIPSRSSCHSNSNVPNLKSLIRGTASPVLGSQPSSTNTPGPQVLNQTVIRGAGFSWRRMCVNMASRLGRGR